MASWPVQPIAASASGAGSVRTTQLPMFVTRFATGRQPVIHALVATTTESARIDPPGVRIEGDIPPEGGVTPLQGGDVPDAPPPSWICVTGERSYRRTPASTTASRNARTKRPGCTVAPSR